SEANPSAPGHSSRETRASPHQPGRAPRRTLRAVPTGEVVQPNLDDVLQKARQMLTDTERRFAAVARAHGQLDDARAELAGHKEDVDVERERADARASKDRGAETAAKHF